MCVFLAAAPAAVGAISAGAALSGAGAAAGVASAGSIAAAGAARAMSAFQIGSLALSALSGGLGSFSQFQQAAGQKAEAKAQAKMASNNQKSAEAAAQDALDRGAEEELQNRRKYSQLAGTQRADFASRGVDLGEGSALAQLDDTMMFERGQQHDQREQPARRLRSAQPGDQLRRQRGDVPLGGVELFAAVADKWYRYKEMALA